MPYIGVNFITELITHDENAELFNRFQRFRVQWGIIKSSSQISVPILIENHFASLFLCKCFNINSWEVLALLILNFNLPIILNHLDFQWSWKVSSWGFFIFTGRLNIQIALAEIFGDVKFFLLISKIKFIKVIITIIKDFILSLIKLPA